MSRLTKDLKTPHDDTTYSDVVVNAVDRENICLTKLKHHEDIEEDIGIDLVTKDKVEQSSECYWKDEDGKIHKIYISETERIGVWVENLDWQKWFLYYNNYGKTWSLVKENLIKEE